MRKEFLDWTRKALEREGHSLIFEGLSQVNGVTGADVFSLSQDVRVGKVQVEIAFKIRETKFCLSVKNFTLADTP